MSPRWAVWCDAPPRRDGGSGTQVLAWNLLEVIRNRAPLVVTRRMLPGLSVAALRAALPFPAVFLPDLAGLPRGRRLLSPLWPALEFALFAGYLPCMRRALAREDCQRLFGLLGGDAWGLLKVWVSASFCRLPFDVYLVEDLATWARLYRRPLLAAAVRRWERTLLRRARQVYVISEGYVEHLWTTYRQPATWLPVAVPHPEVEYHPCQPTAAGVRELLFLGGLNALNADCLRALCAAIAAWNARPARPWRLRLRVMTYSAPEKWLAGVANRADVEVVRNASADEITRACRACWAVFLPYTFDTKWRTLVATAFPTKFVEAMSSGRPVLAFGPADASVPRYFRQHDLPVCVTDPDGLPAGLVALESADTPEVIARYRAVLERHHAPNRIRAILEPDEQAV